ncbi:VOC family protein [Paraflavitalea soli]|uniref:VOC family protein n=1 Tax=Paraflavitalea soli TaxID=2315862 RepID=A0A3B7MY46_9BACT|nr:VOC family protein [Paraflavitalea soli]
MIPTSITPFLVVRNGGAAIEFYTSALGALELFRFTGPDGKLVAKLGIEGAMFWLSDEEPEFDSCSPETVGGTPVRIILTVSDPDTLFARALEAGAIQLSPVTTAHAWKIGKLKDPFGHVWEIGHPLPGNP